MVNQDLERGFKFADAFFCGVCRGSPSQIDLIRRAGEEERSVALRVLASSFHADAAAEARGRFTEAAFIKPASRPQHPSGLEQKTEEGGAGGWQFIEESWL